MNGMLAKENEAWEVVDSMKDSDQKLVKELFDIFSDPGMCKVQHKEKEKLADRPLEIVQMKIPGFDPNLQLLAYGETFLYNCVSAFHRAGPSSSRCWSQSKVMVVKKLWTF